MQEVFLCRHGETLWNLTGQHTSFTDLELTEKGRDQAELLGKRLKEISFSNVFTSPLGRSQETCRIAGFSDTAKVDSDFAEWDYGAYEGLKTDEIRKKVPDWTIFRYGAPNGESVKEVEERAKRAVNKIRKCKGNVLIFSHGHYTRVMGAVWIGLDASWGGSFTLSNASLCILSYEREAPVFRVWNDTSHLLLQK
jgi:broad specificity phosphatase PhoE